MGEVLGIVEGEMVGVLVGSRDVGGGEVGPGVGA